MSVFDNLSVSQKLRAALHRDVRAICSETCHFLGLEVTKPAMEIISELVYKKLSVYGLDLEAFAKHAKRTTITSDDVKLMVRRNPSLKSRLNQMAPTTTVTTKEKRRKTIAAVSKQQETTPKPTEAPPKPIETPSKPIETATKTMDDKENEFENMIIDSTIDLTFD